MVIASTSPTGCKLHPGDKRTFTKEVSKYSNPRKAQSRAYRVFHTRKAKLYPATNPHKKYRICHPRTHTWVQFGQIGYEDYLKHGDSKRRKNYLTRTANMRGNWKHDPYSANNLSRKILW
jgi:hypothetical protein